MMPKIKVIGIGGSGCNTVSRLYKLGLKEIDLVAINTDVQSLKSCSAPKKILIGEKVTGGMGTGMDLKLGEKAAKESREKIKEAIEGGQIIFLTGGLGGGTGTSVLPFAGEISKGLGILTLAVVTLPFSFEGVSRNKLAHFGLRIIQKKVDAYLFIPNDRILKVINKNSSVEEAFLRIDEFLSATIKGIFSLLSSPGIISVDFADLEEVLKNSGEVLFGVGIAKGEQRAIAAASKALQSPLLDLSIKKAKGILFNVGGKDLSLFEVNTVANFIKKIADKKTKIIFGVSENETLDEGEIKVTLIATGVE